MCVCLCVRELILMRVSLCVHLNAVKQSNERTLFIKCFVVVPSHTHADVLYVCLSTVVVYTYNTIPYVSCAHSTKRTWRHTPARMRTVCMYLKKTLKITSRMCQQWREPMNNSFDLYTRRSFIFQSFQHSNKQSCSVIYNIRKSTNTRHIQNTTKFINKWCRDTPKQKRPLTKCKCTL